MILFGQKKGLAMSKNLTVKIAEVTIAIEGHDVLEVLPSYVPFLGNGIPDIRLRLHPGASEIPPGEKVFDCPPIWTLYRQNGTSVIRLFIELPELERILVLPPHFEHADLYFTDNCQEFLDPFFGPCLELLMMHYLAEGRGVILHGCGIAMNSRGILFLGESGAGKSTLARMWEQEHGVHILSDDRIIVRKHGGEYWMYGTPWHGEAAFGSPLGAKLERIFFLRQGQKNSLEKRKGLDALSNFLICSFPPLWDTQGMEFVLELFSSMANELPCHVLSFRPEKSALHLVSRTTR
jgi:hypothetical protein